MKSRRRASRKNSRDGKSTEEAISNESILPRSERKNSESGRRGEIT
jgi:hypothetical protein